MNLINTPYLFVVLAIVSAILARQYNEYLGYEMILFPFKKKVLNRLPLYISKPLGLCIFCNSFWVSISLYCLIWLKGIFIFDIDILFFTSINYITIKVILKYFPV